MKVNELIEILSKMGQDKEVKVEAIGMDPDVKDESIEDVNEDADTVIILI